MVQQDQHRSERVLRGPQVSEKTSSSGRDPEGFIGVLRDYMNWKGTMECKGAQKGPEGSTNVMKEPYQPKGSHRINIGHRGS